MAIPPFPSQDLAKLVLGYLAEEQLMIAYDEFLQASPYLDATKNEYDRFFMTSLKSILAEYRAVKIYVGTCKPLALRKKIFQCSNLLEVVKFLVTNVDINKIQLQEATEKASLEKQKSFESTNACNVCHSLNVYKCVCKSRHSASQVESISISHDDTSSLQNSIETTPLADLPGSSGSHVTTRKKRVKISEKDSINLTPNISSVQNVDSNARQSVSTHISPEEYLASCENDSSSLNLHSTVKPMDSTKLNPTVEEFNTVLESVVNRNKTISVSEPPVQRISNASSFADFVSGVTCGERQNAIYNVPDSSTSENLQLRGSITKDAQNNNIKRPPHSQLLLQVSHVNNSIDIQTCKAETTHLVKLKPPKSSIGQCTHVEKKIKILSDVKVGSKHDDEIDDTDMKNATSTPLMQTIMINGLPAYKNTHEVRAYTQDEIMAMPTLIVVPASGSSQMPTSAHCEAIMTQSSSVSSKESSSPQVLGPLVIDVSPNSNISKEPVVTALPDLDAQKQTENCLIKTLDFKNASVPKDNVVSVETNTPQVLPQMRKSSSTPRRSTHVRVLDFTTPRRILHETINEQLPSQSCDPPVDIVVSASQNVVHNQGTSQECATENIITVANEKECNNDSGSAKENEMNSGAKVILKIKQTKNWDADLRAIVSNDLEATKPRPIPKKKKTPNAKRVEIDKSGSKRKRGKKSPRVKKTKRVIEDDEEPEPFPNSDKKSVPIKPTINILNVNYSTNFNLQKDSKIDTESIKDKSHETNFEDTPETERLSIQNEIGAKLNISDIFETPYKQALYDIQMETPRFADLPGEPLSDIKITSITTPLFLNTPKLISATPSSYSSRPTDYSSGGSYYKPDDKDYMPVPDLSLCPVSSSKEDISAEKSKDKDGDEKKSRPVRQCTKNVSYYKNFSLPHKSDENVDARSSCSESLSANGSFESKKKDLIPETPRSNTDKKSNTKKRNSSCRKKKSPKMKDKTKSFMKIKPRYTPKKDTPSVRKRKSNIKSPYSKESGNFPQRKRVSKEKSVNTTAAAAAVPTKSRRKSSTPRKLHCTKTFNSESSGHNSPEMTSTVKSDVRCEKTFSSNQDSDNEQLALRWSDDGSQDVKTKEMPMSNEIEDISKIKEFIDSSDSKVHRTHRDSKQENSLRDRTRPSVSTDPDGALQRDLMNRGFDLETAKIIERDLLGDNSAGTESTTRKMLPISVEIVATNDKDSTTEEATDTIDSTADKEQEAVQDEDNIDIELNVYECNEETANYHVFQHDDTKEISQKPPIKLRDNYSMEICIEDQLVRLRLAAYSLLFDQDPLTVDEIDYSYKETELAVSSISNMERLYTPLKDSLKAQCYEIFDSTLTSLDTPLKARSPLKKCETSVTELVIEKEIEAKEKPEGKKRKRLQHIDELTSSSKRSKPDADLLLKTTNIKNIDIETVLTKLHGH